MSMLRWSPILMATLSLAAVHNVDAVQAQEAPARSSDPSTIVAEAQVQSSLSQSQSPRVAIHPAVTAPTAATEVALAAMVPTEVVPTEVVPAEMGSTVVATKAVASPAVPLTPVDVTVNATVAAVAATATADLTAVAAADVIPQATGTAAAIAGTTAAIAQNEQQTPNNIRISPDQPPSATPSLNTPPPTVIPETNLPPSEVNLPSSAGTPAIPLAPSGQPVRPPATTPNPNPSTKPEPRVLVAEVAIKGATDDLENTVYGAIRTKAGQTTTRTQLQEDINAIFATGYFANVQAAPEDTPLGVRVTFVVEPNPVLRSVELQGSVIVPKAEVEEIFRPQYGTTLNLRQLQQSIQTLTKKYQDKGFVLAQIVDVPKISPDGVVTLEVAEGQIESVQVRFLNKDGSNKDDQGNPIKGRTRDFIITREMETKAGSVFNRTIAERDLQRIFGLGIFDDAKLDLDPASDPRKVNVVINVAERNAGSVSAGGGVSSASGLFGTVSYQQQNLGGNNQKLGAEVQFGQRETLFDVNFSDPWIAGDPFRTSYNVNLFRRQSLALIFDSGKNDVRILNANGLDRDQPRVVRTGGGVSFTRPLSKDVFKLSPWTASLGFQYQSVRIQDANGNLVQATTPQTNSAGTVVGFGRDLSFSGTGKDDILSVQFGLLNDQRNNPLQPTSGSRISIGTEQSIPIGAGSIFFNRLRASYSYFIPTRLLKIAPGCRDVPPGVAIATKPKSDCPQTLAFNLQAGTVFGDLPPYEAFTLGGSNSVRGYEDGFVGSGKSFLQATAEYRFPVFSIISGALFVDAATDLGTGSSVKGNPAALRGEPGRGLGYGLGIRIQTPFLGAIRLDYGFNDQGQSRLHFGLGERF